MFNATSNLDFIDESQNSFDQTLKQDFYPEIQNYIRRLNFGYEEKRMIDHCEHFLELLMTVNPLKELLSGSFFLEDFIPKNIQSLLICRVILSEKLEEVLNKCLEQTVLLWLKVQPGEYPELDNTVEKIFDSTQLYHSKVSFLKQPEYLTWIILDYEIDLNTLKEGDLIDCVKTDPVLKTKCWSHAEIIGINESSLIVCFINDKTQSIEKSAYIIAPFKTKCKDSESGIPLKEGDEINLVGSPSQYNKSIPDTSPRISMKDTTVKSLERSENWPKDQQRIYDSGDLIYPLSSYKRKVYAVQREEVSKSVFLVNLLNTFGENGGFEHIYNQIADKKTWEDIKVVGYLCSLIKKMSYFFHREFALEYIPKLQEAVLKNIAVLSDGSIKDFTLKNLEDIISTCETLLLRMYSVTETLETVNKLKLEICRHCFESPKSETKLEALDLVYKIIPLLDNETFSGFSKKAFHEFLADNNIYEKTFLSKDNKVLENSSTILVYCLSKDLIGLPGLEKVCSNLIQANHRCKEVFHGMLSSKLKPKKYAPFMEFFISHLSDLHHPSQVTPAEISFLIKMLKTFPISDLSVQKYLSFCWQVVTSYDYDAKVVEKN